MTAEHVRQEPAVTPSAVRLCDNCGRPLPALHKNEYTPVRANLVAVKGFCVCRPGGPDDATRIPDRAPSLVEGASYS
jgi:hypothetical protein